MVLVVLLGLGFAMTVLFFQCERPPLYAPAVDDEEREAFFATREWDVV